jgi:hypothetical protein
MKKVSNTYLLFPVLFILYLLFPTSNSSMDAYEYAAEIRYGVHPFQPFHLLYNAFGNLLFKCCGIFFQTDALSLMKSLNAVAAVVCLFLLDRILCRMMQPTQQRILLILCCGFSFGVWRFAAENETYIIPIVFSLAASFYYLKFRDTTHKRNIILAGLWAAIACLFHVIHFFWWLGLMSGVATHKNKKDLLLYLLPSLVCPIVYVAVISIDSNCGISPIGIWSYFQPTLTGNTVQYTIGWDNLYLGVISLFRTFYQVHGNISILVIKHVWLLVPAIISIGFALLALIRIVKQNTTSVRNLSGFIIIHIIILILQLLFAFYSKGNAEFMVMLPFLLAIGGCHYFKRDLTILTYTSISLFVWNLTFGILPNHYADFNKQEKLLTMVRQHKNIIFLLPYPGDMQNQLFYATGMENTTSVQWIPGNKHQLDILMKKASATGTLVLTDFYEKPDIMDRYRLTQRQDYSFMNGVKHEKVDSFTNFYGKNYIYKMLY